MEDSTIYVWDDATSTPQISINFPFWAVAVSADVQMPEASGNLGEGELVSNQTLTLISFFTAQQKLCGGWWWVDQPITNPISGSSLDFLQTCPGVN